jgi:hypothetical protein
LNTLIVFVFIAGLVAIFQIGPSSSLAQTANTTQNTTQVSNQTALDANLLYIVVFGNKTIGNIDNQTNFVSSVVGNSLEKIREEFVKSFSMIPSEQLKKEINQVVDAGVSGAGCKNIIHPVDRKVDCIKSGDKVIWFVSEVAMPKSQVINKTSSIGLSIDNGTLGYKTVYEHTTSPKTFTPEQQAAIDTQCNILRNNYSSLSNADRGWFLANC